MSTQSRDTIPCRSCRHARAPHALHYATARLSKVMHQLHDLVNRTNAVEHQLRAEVGAVNTAAAVLDELNKRQIRPES